MNKTLPLFVFLAFLLAFLPSFISCKGDSDSAGSSSSITCGPITLEITNETNNVNQIEGESTNSNSSNPPQPDNVEINVCNDSEETTIQVQDNTVLIEELRLLKCGDSTYSLNSGQEITRVCS